MSARKHSVHQDAGGRARCGNRGARLLGSGGEVTCTRCLKIAAGTYGVGHRQPEEPCGTAAAYRRHKRHGERACPWCLAAERRRNRGRRERYGEAA